MSLRRWSPVVYVAAGCAALVASFHETTFAAEPVDRAVIDGSEEGFRLLTADDFAAVNSADDTWSFVEGEIRCTGQPV